MCVITWHWHEIDIHSKYPLIMICYTLIIIPNGGPKARRVTQLDQRSSLTTEKFTLIKVNSKLAYDSFYPASIRRWNSLTPEITNVSTVEELKNKLNEDIPSPRKWLYEGERRAQILHCRLRVKNADLNENLHDRNLKPSPECQCGNPSETTPHYLLWCPLYENQRLEMLLAIDPQFVITTHKLLHGTDELSIDEYNI